MFARCKSDTGKSILEFLPGIHWKVILCSSACCIVLSGMTGPQLTVGNNNRAQQMILYNILWGKLCLDISSNESNEIFKIWEDNLYVYLKLWLLYSTIVALYIVYCILKNELWCLGILNVLFKLYSKIYHSINPS